MFARYRLKQCYLPNFNLMKFLLSILVINTFLATAVINDNAKQFMEAMNMGNYILLDVRTANEVSKGKISGSIHIDWFDDDFATKASALDKKKTILVYCASGGRSEEAAELLAKQGFNSVHNLVDGIAAWKEAGYPIVK